MVLSQSVSKRNLLVSGAVHDRDDHGRCESKSVELGQPPIPPRLDEILMGCPQTLPHRSW